MTTSLSDRLFTVWLPPNGAKASLPTDHLLQTSLLILTVLFAIAQVLLILPILQKKKRSAPPLKLWQTEILPLALICALFAWMTITAQQLWASARFEGPNPEAMQVEAVGVQFQWYFRYPGTDATFGQTRPQLVDPAAANPLGLDPADPNSTDDIVASELVLPANREIDLRLRAHDVIHGLFIPGMRLKQNAVPGTTLHIHFTPTEPGQYDILCSQVCGLGHGHMQAKLRILPPAGFQAWLSARQQKRLAETTASRGGS